MFANVLEAIARTLFVTLLEATARAMLALLSTLSGENLSA